MMGDWHVGPSWSNQSLKQSTFQLSAKWRILHWLAGKPHTFMKWQQNMWSFTLMLGIGCFFCVSVVVLSIATFSKRLETNQSQEITKRTWTEVNPDVDSLKSWTIDGASPFTFMPTTCCA
jgi:hypothetical protein